MGTISDKLTKTGLLKLVGDATAECGFGTVGLPKGTILKIFWLPNPIVEPISDYFPLLGSIIEQDSRAIVLDAIDFNDMEILSVDLTDGIDSLLKIPKIRLGIRELAVLLSDYENHNDYSILEHLRKTQGLTCLHFPGTTLYFDLHDNKFYGMYYAFYNSETECWEHQVGWLESANDVTIDAAFLNPESKFFKQKLLRLSKGLLATMQK